LPVRADRTFWSASRFFCRHQDLDAVDHALVDGRIATDLSKLADELERVEREVRGISVPLSCREELYDLRAHIELLRAKVGVAATATRSLDRRRTA
jgi:hypothetical protein